MNTHASRGEKLHSHGSLLYAMINIKEVLYGRYN